MPAQSGGLISDGGVYTYHKCLKALLNRAYEFGCISENPYSRLRGKFKRGEKENIEFLTEEEIQRIMDLKLPAGSKIMLAGGWKQYYREQVDKTEFYDTAKRVLGVDDENIVEFYGAVEHPIAYCDCKNHHFHVPVYSKVIIRDPDTLEPLENGKMGLVNLVTPICKATPLLSVMTDDLGILHDGEKCGCGVTSPYLEIVGRVAPEDIKTCAAGAADILKGVKI